VGTTTVAHALHRLLAERDVRHAVIEGDLLDLAHPAPWEHGLAERNLAAVWSNYRDLGYRRLAAEAPESVLRLPTDGRTPEALAVDLAALIGWSPLSGGGAPSGSGGPGMTPSPTRPSEPARRPA
jgi:hypothetical protein